MTETEPAARPILPENQPAASKFHGLQQLRAAAAILVMVGHVIVRAVRDVPHDPRLDILVTQLGQLGVRCFFVISGFIMLHVSWNRFGKHGQAARFVRDRAIRVIPLYWLLTLIYVAFTKEPTPLANVVKSLLFLPHPNALDALPYPVFALGWTLEYEILFYAIFAVGMLLSRRSASIAFVVTVLLALTLVGAGAGATLHGLGTAATFWTAPILLFFLAGMAICMAHRHGVHAPWRWSGLAALAVLVADVPVAVLLADHAPAWSAASIALAAIVAVALVTLCPSPSGGVIGRGGEFLGDASYSLYLSHPFCIIVAAQVWMKLVPALSPGVFIALTVLGSLIGGIACYVLVERRLIRLFQRRRKDARIVRDDRASAFVTRG
jgi:peptidoglycan/LPS O-acetylase OafA/YrhL